MGTLAAPIRPTYDPVATTPDYFGVEAISDPTEIFNLGYDRTGGYTFVVTQPAPDVTGPDSAAGGTGADCCDRGEALPGTPAPTETGPGPGTPATLVLPDGREVRTTQEVATAVAGLRGLPWWVLVLALVLVGMAFRRA